MNIIKNSVIIILSLFSLSTFSQEKLLGKAKNLIGEPIVNAIIYVDGKKTETKTNARGYFELDVVENTKTISVLSKEYGLLTVKYEDQEFLSFMYVNERFNADSEITTNDKVSIGYGRVERKNSTFDTANLQFEDRNNNDDFNTIFDLIRARLKGVRVTRANRVIIRGFSAGSNPLFVVNGQIMDDISFIRPVEVNEINILKGAASSMYGSRASKGVIEITLKGG